MTDDEREENEIAEANEWLEDNAELSVPQLNKLAAEGTPEALERLRNLAEDHDVEYDANTSPQELAGKIALAMDQENELNHG